jgi:large subunit ribosomal protein L29
MNAKELRDKDDKALNKSLHDELRKLFNLRMQRATGQNNRHHQFKEARRNVARIKTILNERAKAGSGA